MAGFGDIKSWDFNYLHMFLYELIASTTLLYQLTCIYSPISMGEPGIFQFCGSPLLKCMANTQVVSKVVACYGYVLLKRNIHKIICNLESKGIIFFSLMTAYQKSHLGVLDSTKTNEFLPMITHGNYCNPITVFQMKPWLSSIKFYFIDLLCHSHTFSLYIPKMPVVNHLHVPHQSLITSITHVQLIPSKYSFIYSQVQSSNMFK